MPSKHIADQAQSEREVFLDFAADAGLSVTSVTSYEPPAPDLLCEIAGNSPVAYELVEIVDQRFRHAMAQIEEARAALAKHLTPARAATLAGMFGTAFVSLRMLPTANRRQRGAAIPAILAWLGTLNVASDFVPDPASTPTNRLLVARPPLKLAAVLHHALVELDRPKFHLELVPAALWVCDPTVAAILEKLEADYEGDHEFELLAWTETSWFNDLPKWRAEVISQVAATLEASRFRRVTVYQRHRRGQSDAIALRIDRIGGKCWIYNSDKKLTREHFPKKADTRSYMQAGRLYRHSANRRNEIIQGPGSERLTLGAPMCALCNNTLTQPHDRAWDALRDHLLADWPAIVAAGEFDLRSIYSTDWVLRAMELHLYFLKVLGCVIVEQRIPIPIEPLRNALLSGSAHPCMYLVFSDSHPLNCSTPRRMMGPEDMHAMVDRESGVAHMAYWRYTLQPVSVRICFVAPEFPDRPILAAWRPLAANSVVRLGPPVFGVDVPPLRQ
jgi:hypothetical protein